MAKQVNKLRKKLQSKKEDLARRHKESVARKDQGRFGSIFLKSKIPEGISFWKCGNGKHLIDIIPFEAGPTIPNPNVEEGDPEFYVDVWVHRNVGAADLVFVCPAYTWGKDCPICEDIKESDYSDEDLEKIRAKRRTIYLVWVHDSPKEESEGLKILDLAYFFLQSHLDELAESPRTGGIITYADVDDGKSIGFTKQGGGPKNTKFIGHQFVDREEPIPDKILDQSFPLDTCIKMQPTYDEIADAYFGKEKAEAEQEGEQATDPEETTSGEAEEEAQGDPDDNGQGTLECPAGGVFGKDVDELNDCAECKIWDECAAEGQRMQSDSEPEKKPEEPPKEEKKEEEKRTPLRRRRRPE